MAFRKKTFEIKKNKCILPFLISYSKAVYFREIILMYKNQY